MHPLARRSDLFVQRVGDDLVAYDSVRDVAHALDPLAAYVYQHADGTRDVAALTAGAAAALGRAVDSELVELALAELERAQLLSGALPQRRKGLSRREVLRRVGIAAVLPLVTSLLVPAPVLAKSPSTLGGAPDPGNEDGNGNGNEDGNSNGNGNGNSNGNGNGGS